MSQNYFVLDTHKHGKTFNFSLTLCRSSFANHGTVISDGAHMTYLDFISHVILYVVAVSVYIMQTCPCNIYPLTPHFYIVKLGFTGVYIFF